MTISTTGMGLYYLLVFVVVTTTTVVEVTAAASEQVETCDNCECVISNADFLRQFIDDGISTNVENSASIMENVNATLENRIALGIEAIIDDTIDRNIAAKVSNRFLHRPGECIHNYIFIQVLE